MQDIAESHRISLDLTGSHRISRRPGIRAPELFVAMVTVASLASVDVRAQCMSDELATVNAGAAHFATFSLTSGQNVTWETTGTSSGGDPVLRLFDAASPTELAVDDNGAGGVEARIAFQVPATGDYTIMVHSRSDSTAGTTSLEFNSVVGSQFSFHGAQFTFCSMAPDHVLRTGHAPFGPSRHVAVFAAGSAAGASSGIGDGIVEQSVSYVHSSGSVTTVVAIVSSPDGSSGPIFAARTENGSADNDSDGLSSDFEDDAGTCDDAMTLIGSWDCGQYGISPDDTDRDGLSDFVEFFGDCGKSGTPECLSLMRWGADPRHKDIFYEADYKAASFSWGATFADGIVARLGTEASLGDGPAITRNPDGLPGVRLHLDFALHDPQAPLSRSNMPFLVFNNTDDDPSLGSALEPDESGITKCTSGTYGYDHLMSPLRRQYYRWGRWQNGGGGVATVGPSWPSRLCSNSNAQITAHEIGHNMGLHHGGYNGVNGKANYRSLMNYLGQNNLPSFSSGAAYDLDPSAMDESLGLAPSSAQTEYQAWIKDYLGFPVSGASVDWSRNRVFTGSTSAVRGRLFGWMSSSDGTKPAGNLSGQLTVAALNNEDQVQVSSSLVPCNSPDVVRYDYGTHDRAYVIWPICGNWNMREVHVDYDGACPASYSYSGSCGGSSWSSPVNTGRVGTTVAAEVVPSGSGGAPFIYVASVEPTSGDIRILQAVPDSSGNLSSFSWTHTISGPVAGEPDISLHGDDVWVVWRDDNTELWGTHLNILGGSWSSPAKLLVSSGGASITSRVSPRLAVNGDTGNLYLARTDSSDRVILHWLSGSNWPASGLFDLPDNAGQNDARIRITRRPGLVWLPDDFGNPTGPGSFLIAEQNASQMSDLRVYPNNGFSFGRLRNVGSTVGGVSLWYEPGSGDDNPLLVSSATAFGGGAGGIRFFGYADGVVPYTFKDFDDQSKFADIVCPSIRGGSYDSCDESSALLGSGESTMSVAAGTQELAFEEAGGESLQSSDATCDGEANMSEGVVIARASSDLVGEYDAVCVECEGR